ncbi:MAG TPA: FtsW/RodA/SpoVE family cell cycle protein [Candidatus Paceibacterota bacterium]
MRRASRIDKPLTILLVILVVGGAFVFSSAAFGLLGRGETHITSVVFNHFALGLGLGLLALLLGLTVDYRIWRRYALALYIAALALTALVFIPTLGLEHGGGTRWLDIFGFSFQPSEVLKVAAIIMAAAYFAGMKTKTATFSYGLGGFIGLMVAPAVLLLLQPDLGTLGVISISVLAVYIAAGARWRDVAIVIVLAMLALGAIAIMRPYVMDRLLTFINPAQGQHDQAYQIRQSLIAIGSGGFSGRGFGQGVQKFTYLPEPMGDSVFAVAAEELGFIGAVGVVATFAAFALRGLTVGARAPDLFGALLAIGISTYLGAEAFVNIAAMLGLAPLTGVPLTFVSQGGSAMLAALGSAGLLLNVSRHRARAHA